jgi:glucose-6-phosphate isomerase
MMKRLSIRGIRLENEGTKLFEEGSELEPLVRTVKELDSVLMNRTFVTRQNGNDPLYYMFRGVGSLTNRMFAEHEMRYDITILENYDLGGELNKTIGHYHPTAEGDLAYPEVYEVFSGEALFILQKRLSGSTVDLRLVRASTGEKIMVPPNYGHIAVNMGDGFLITGNLSNSVYRSDYEPIKKMGGGAVYVLSDKTIVPNEAYENVQVPQIQKAPKTDFLGKESLYDQFLKDPEKFEFLSRPSLLFKD